MIWKNSSYPTSFSAHLCNITFHNCTFEDTNLQFTGLNTNLLIRNTLVRNCSSQGTNIPLFFMQLFYNYAARLFIQNSKFLYNKSPIIYAMQFEEILVQDTLFLKNGKDITSSTSMVKVSGSSVILRNSIVNGTLGPAIEVKNVNDFTSNKVVFVSNNGTTASCLVVKNHSNVSLVDTAFKQNTNPVISVNDDGINISLKVCFTFLHNSFIFLPHISFFPAFFPRALFPIIFGITSSKIYRTSSGFWPIKLPGFTHFSLQGIRLFPSHSILPEHSFSLHTKILFIRLVASVASSVQKTKIFHF